MSRLAAGYAVTAALGPVVMAPRVGKCGQSCVRAGLFGTDDVWGSELAIRLIHHAEWIRRGVDR